MRLLGLWAYAKRMMGMGMNRGEHPPEERKDYRIPAEAAGRADAELAWAVVEPIWALPTGSYRDAHLPPAWNNVTRGQLIVYVVTWVEREVLNGGFWQYLYNSKADLPSKALQALEEMGWSEYAALLREAIAALPGGILPKTRWARRRVLPYDPYDQDLPDRERAMLDRLSDLDDRFYALYGDGKGFYHQLAEYIRAHPGEFFMPEPSAGKG